LAKPIYVDPNNINDSYKELRKILPPLTKSGTRKTEGRTKKKADS